MLRYAKKLFNRFLFKSAVIVRKQKEKKIDAISQWGRSLSDEELVQALNKARTYFCKKTKRKPPRILGPVDNTTPSLDIRIDFFEDFSEVSRVILAQEERENAPSKS